MPEALTAFCATHAAAPAVVTCKRCGSFLCEACVTLEGDESYCAACTALRHRPASSVARAAYYLSIVTIAVGFSSVLLSIPLFLLAPFTWLAGVVLIITGRRPLRAGDGSENTRRLLGRSTWISVGGFLMVLQALVFVLWAYQDHLRRLMN